MIFLQMVHGYTPRNRSDGTPQRKDEPLEGTIRLEFGSSDVNGDCAAFQSWNGFTFENVQAFQKTVMGLKKEGGK